MYIFRNLQEMNRNKWAIGALFSFGVVAILHLIDKLVTPVSDIILLGSRYVFLAFLIMYAIGKKNLTTWILVAMAIGTEIGLDFPAFSQNLQFLSKIFLRLVKTIVAPLLFATLVIGIAGHANIKQVGRMGWKSLLYFEVVTTIALFIGILVINLTRAGDGILVPEALLKELPETKAKGWADHIIDIFPENIVKSIYEGNVLPIVVFSVIFAIGLALLDEHKKKPMLEFCESLAEVMFKFTNIIMYFAPFGVGAAIAVTVGHLGIDILKNLFLLLCSLYIALFIFLLLVLLPVALYIKIPLKQFWKAVKEPASIAFATTSSDSALPKLLSNMERFGVPRHIVSFVVPTGYTFNLDGTTLYLSLASVFVAQAAGINWFIGEQLMVGLSLMLTSKGVAAVPRASLVILIATATTFNLPMWPIMAIYGIDELMDMARTSVNVIGNSLASCVIARWEGEFDDEKALEFKEG
jgi:proton glutamate symport protein